MEKKEMICTMEKSIPLKVDGFLKPSKLIKLYKFLFGKEFEHQHNAKYDVLATSEVFRELVKRKLVCI
jgi:DNA polymerase III epsilon subunit-like protein